MTSSRMICERRVKHRANHAHPPLRRHLQFDTPAGSVGTNGVYGQVEYAVTPDFTLVGRYDYLIFDFDTPAGEPPG
jgi:hypothetical protein